MRKQRFGCYTGTVSHVITGRQMKHKGFWFCHADENARSKFCDEIANKVADLMSEKAS